MRKLKAYGQARQTHVRQNAVLTNPLVDFKADGASAATSEACWTKACRRCHWVTFVVSIAGAFTDAASDTTAGGLANLSSLVAISVSAKKQTNADKKQATPDKKQIVAILGVGTSDVSPKNSKIIVIPINNAHNVSNAMAALTSQPRFRSCSSSAYIFSAFVS